MTDTFATPQDAEDCFYDSLEENDLDKMMSVWDSTGNILCLLPMASPLIGTEAVRSGWDRVMQAGMKIDILVSHLHWIETEETAIHVVEQRIELADSDHKQPPIFATNIYRRTASGWALILHQTAPAPPPPGMQPGMPPGM